MKYIVSISPLSASNNFDEIIEFQGEKIRVSQYCVDGHMQLAKKLVEKFDGYCDVIILSGFPNPIRFKNKTVIHPSLSQLKSLVRKTLVVDGHALRDLYIPWVLRNFAQKEFKSLKYFTMGLHSGLVHHNMINVLEEMDWQMLMADPYYFCRIPFLLHTHSELENFFRYFYPYLMHVSFDKFDIRNFSDPWPKKIGTFSDFLKCPVLFAHRTELQYMSLNHLKDKIVILDYLNPVLEKSLKKVGVNQVVSCMPPILNTPHASFGILEGVLQAFQKDPVPMGHDDLLGWVDQLRPRPVLRKLNKKVAVDTIKFAFIIHPLQTSDFFRAPILKPFQTLGKKFEAPLKTCLRQLSYLNYGEIKGIESSATGQKVEGKIYSLFETPSMMMEVHPEVIYEKLLTVCNKAKEEGAKIIGLGAYTKIVGDAGVTVAHRSPIPVTTGNSLSAAATLWAARLAVKEMGFVQQDEKECYQGKVMIVGATGSIGAVLAKLLARTWREVVLMAPRPHRLLELREEVEKLAPGSNIIITTDSNREISSCDLIITTTSAQGRRILDIEKVKPGCVICDVSRPFDISKEEALKRPDVLVIASGEVELPGHVEMSCDLGLEDQTVYACLAETAVLALEGYLESFTLSRNISYQKVLKIDELSKKHGVRLAAIMGHFGPVTESEIKLAREHAEKRLKRWSINDGSERNKAQ